MQPSNLKSHLFIRLISLLLLPSAIVFGNTFGLSVWSQTVKAQTTIKPITPSAKSPNPKTPKTKTVKPQTNLKAQATDKPESVKPQTTQGLMIQADSQEANSKTEVVTARGNVRLNYPSRKVEATANLAQYYIKQKRIVLTGNVLIVQNGNTVEGESVVYLVEEGKFIANPKSKQQVQSKYIVPNEGGKAVIIQSNTQEANSKTQIVTAKGSVNVSYPAKKLRAKANMAQYNIKQKQILLSGNVLVVQDGNSLQGETITYLIDEGRFVAKQKSGMPVQSIYVLPDEGKTNNSKEQ